MLFLLHAFWTVIYVLGEGRNWLGPFWKVPFEWSCERVYACLMRVCKLRVACSHVEAGLLPAALQNTLLMCCIWTVEWLTLSFYVLRHKQRTLYIIKLSALMKLSGNLMDCK